MHTTKFIELIDMNLFSSKISYLISSVTFAVLAFQPALAGVALSPATVANPVTGEPVANVVAPCQALNNSHAIVPLGVAEDDGDLVEGYAIVHYKKGYKKPDNPGKPGGGPSDPSSSCYGFLSKGARWKTTEPYVVAPDVDAVAVASDLDAWDSQVAFDVFGGEDETAVVDGADTSSPDGKNEIMFGEISSPGAIAVSIVWGVFGGPPQNRRLVEYDVVFDNVDYVWGDATVDLNVMDFENIATHEFGHAAGLADLYDSGCSEQTMYGYADYGETSKRTLETGDINGIMELYK